MKQILLILIGLVFVWQSCTDRGQIPPAIEPPNTDGPRISTHYIVLKNVSAYDVTIHYYNKEGKNPYVWSIFYPISIPKKKEVKYGGCAPVGIYCWVRGLGCSALYRPISFDSLRVYFNEGQPGERYITYKKTGFKPRDLRKGEEYDKYENEMDALPSFYYTFTNEDYNNALEHQNTMPVPIPKCLANSCYNPVDICYDD